ncbi:MAG: YicC/YloC family endoribonuclease [Paracoccaceae bacterium]
MVNATVNSMTGYAGGSGAGAGCSWVWDLRAVNGKGLDLRLRIPDWIDGAEAAIRQALGPVVQRGNVTLTLKLERDPSMAGIRLNPAGARAALAALAAAEAAAAAQGIELAPMTAADILQIRGVLDQGGEFGDTAELLAALMADLPPLLAAFAEARAAEGAALAAVIDRQITSLSDLTALARSTAEARRPQVAAALNDNLARILSGAAEADPARVAQELAILAIKSDVTEELDRLTAHIEAARALLSGGGAIGKKFDFLMQEFMREANTLCSKSGNVDLTRIGLDLKTVIDQMREQVQNLE